MTKFHQAKKPTRHGRNRRASTKSAPLRLYGFHTVRAALQNPKRTWRKLYASSKAVERIGDVVDDNSLVSVVESRELERMVGAEAVHQGLVLEAEPLAPVELDDVADSKLLVVLDQVTDPHNVGAILRSAAAMGAGAMIVTHRHSASESAVLAKSASGALDLVPMVASRHLWKTLIELNERGVQTVGLDSAGPHPLEQILKSGPKAIVLGAEGRGLREKTSQSCAALARLDVPGSLSSLNVSNAAVLALYLAAKAE